MWQKAFVRARELRNRVGVARWIRGSRGGLVALALIVGVGAGLGAVAFRSLIAHATRIFSGTSDYSAVGRIPHPWVPGLGIYFVVLAPVLGGLIYGPLVDRFAREARGHGVPEVMFAIANRGGRIPARVAGVKALASAICIGAGGSVGREGPIVQIGSALGSSLGQVAKVSESRLRTLVACGAAGGIAATFNAPIAGVFFALELLLGNFATEAFSAVVLASVTASVIGRAAFGNVPFLHLPAFSISSPKEYLLYAALGVLAAVVGVFFTKILYAIEDLCDWAWRGPEWARPAAGGVLLGLLLLALPEMYGVGYPVLQQGLEGHFALTFLLVLLFGKILATSLTIGIGGSGGVFAPSLFIGAMMGAAFGDVAHAIAPQVTGPIGAYALVGMGAVFAGAARAPITAVLIIFELTGEYTIILPLMLAIVVATGVSRSLMPDTVYTLKLRRRGVNLSRAQATSGGATTRVETAMGEAPQPVEHDMLLEQVARRLLASDTPSLPVVKDGKLVGVVTAKAVSRALAEDQDGLALTAKAVTEQPPLITTRTSLLEAAQVLASGDSSAAPVVDDQGQMAGWLTHRALLAALSVAVQPPK